MIAATIGEFDDAQLFVNAARHMRERRIAIDAYMPHAIPELDDALGIRRTKLRWWVLAAGLGGLAVAFAIQHWCNAIDYPYLVGGRPYASIPTDVPIMFETAVLFAGTTAFLAMLVLSRMPRLWSPILDVPGYERTSVDRFWIVVPQSDPAWSRAIGPELASLGAVSIKHVGEAE
ncbi:MAG TPA: DUF3341 domain-containing protein [Labilithrix sp.]|jgi:hypothetical protein